MLTPNEVRKKCGCWGCANCGLRNVTTEAEVFCNHESTEIREGFSGWETALTCKGFKMKPYTVDVIKKEE